MPAQPAPEKPLIVLVVADAAHSKDPALTTRKNELYADGISRHGGDAVLVSAATPPAERDRHFGAMSGLVLTGGADLDPALYHEPIAGATDIDADRDGLEQLAWREAERRSVPVYGICRGFQAINVFSGGSLLQDVPSHAGTPYGAGPAKTHDLEIDPNSRLARALAAGSPEGLAATAGSWPSSATRNGPNPRPTNSRAYGRRSSTPPGTPPPNRWPEPPHRSIRFRIAPASSAADHSRRLR